MKGLCAECCRHSEEAVKSTLKEMTCYTLVTAWLLYVCVCSILCTHSVGIFKQEVRGQECSESLINIEIMCTGVVI